jgi:hypothetical protein
MGRPRIYENGAARVAAFRQRQKQTGRNGTVTKRPPAGTKSAPPPDLKQQMSALRTEITHRRKADKERRQAANWNPPACLTIEESNILNYIEDELARMEAPPALRTEINRRRAANNDPRHQRRTYNPDMISHREQIALLDYIEAELGTLIDE